MSAFCPEGGLPRLFRYVNHMPLPNIVAMLFRNENLLLIDREHWDRLDDTTRHRVMRTEEKLLEIEYPPNKPPRVTSRSN